MNLIFKVSILIFPKFPLLKMHLIHRLVEEEKEKKALSQGKGSSKHTGLLHNYYSWFQSPLNMLFN